MTAKVARLLGALLGLSFALPLSPAGRPPDDRPRVSFSREPQYDPTRDVDDASQLVDGETVNGTMWLSRKAVGWIADGRPIAIDLAFRARRTAGGACLHLSQKPDADALYPQAVNLFGDDGATGWRWLGAVFPSEGQERAGPDEYAVQNACIRFAPRSLERMKLVVNTSGPYFFVDEIALVRGRLDASDREANATAVLDDPVSFALERNAIRGVIRSYARAAKDPRGEGALHLLAGIDTGSAARDRKELAQLGRKFGLARLAGAHSAQSGIAVAVDPFGPAGPLDSPPRVSSPEMPLPNGQIAIAAASIVSRSPSDGRFGVTFGVHGAAASGVSTSLFTVEPTVTASGKVVGDMLKPLTTPLTVAAGSQRMVWAIVQARPAAPAGNVTGAMAVTNLASGKVENVRWGFRVVRFSPPAQQNASVAWSYADRPPFVRYPRDAARDADEHGVNTAVIPASLVPWPAWPRDGNARVDYDLSDQTLSLWSNSQRILLFLGFKDDRLAPGQRFGRDIEPFGPEWEKRFRSWLSAWTAHLRSKGFDGAKIAFYPMDEPGTAIERRRFVRLAEAIRKAAPGVPIYTTLRVVDDLPADFLASIDMVQLDTATFDPAFAARLRRAGKQVWLYSAEETGKGADPLATYRALAWRAFANGLTGIGVWSHSQNGDEGSPFNDLDGSERDRAMVYPAPAGWYSSRRWEAFRLANQDAALLQAASERAVTAADRAHVKALAAAGVRANAGGDSEKLVAIQLGLLALAQAR